MSPTPLFLAWSFPPPSHESFQWSLFLVCFASSFSACFTLAVDSPKRQCLREEEQAIKPDTPAIRSVRSRQTDLTSSKSFNSGKSLIFLFYFFIFPFFAVSHCSLYPALPFFSCLALHLSTLYFLLLGFKMWMTMSECKGLSLIAPYLKTNISMCVFSFALLKSIKN